MAANGVSSSANGANGHSPQQKKKKLVLNAFVEMCEYYLRTLGHRC